MDDFEEAEVPEALSGSYVVGGLKVIRLDWD
jgi:hypothetical protein